MELVIFLCTTPHLLLNPFFSDLIRVLRKLAIVDICCRCLVDGHRVVARRLLGEAALLLPRWDRGWEGNVSTRVREMGAGGRGVATARDAKVQDWKFEYGN